MTELAYTRATTVANTLESRFGLEAWAKRNVVLGIAARPDLYALAASYKPADKEQLNQIVNDAEEAAKARSGRNLGTALHRITARIDTGEDFDAPKEWRPDVDAYLNTLADNAVKVLPEYVERVVVASKAKIAGTFDRLVVINGETYVADLKTGANAITYGVNSIAVQLAIYANADYLWKGDAEVADQHRDYHGRYLLPDPSTDPDAYEPMPEVNKERAVIIHLPVEEGRCDLYWVDIAAGVEGVKMSLWAREWRNRELHFPLNPEPFAMTPTEPELEEVFQLITEEFNGEEMTAKVIPIGGAKADDDW